MSDGDERVNANVSEEIEANENRTARGDGVEASDPVETVNGRVTSAKVTVCGEAKGCDNDCDAEEIWTDRDQSATVCSARF